MADNRLAPLALGLLAALSCGKVVPRPAVMGPSGGVPTPGTLAPAAPHAPALPPDGATPTRERAPFRLAWRQQTRPFNKALALARTGHLAVLGSRHLSLHVLATGERLAETDVCFTFPSALGLVADTRAALVCEDAIRVFSVPELRYRGHQPLPDKARTAAFGAELVAVGFDQGPVRLYDTADWQQVGEVALAERATALAVSPDGNSLAIGLEHGEVIVLDRSADEQRRVVVKQGFEVQALAFASAGDRLLAAAGPVTKWWRTADPDTATPLPLVHGVRAARWVDDREAVTVGEEGLLLVSLDQGSTESVGEGWGDDDVAAAGLASLPGQAVVCAAAREGLVSCFSRGALPATRQLPLLDEPGGKGAQRMAGRVQHSAGDRLQVKAHAGATLPPVGIRVVVLHYVERALGGWQQVRWERVAEGLVDHVDKDVVHVSLATTVATRWPNGRDDQGPLAYDAAVRLVWPPR